MRPTRKQSKAIKWWNQQGFKLSTDAPVEVHPIADKHLVLVKEYQSHKAVAVVDTYGKTIKRQTIW